MYNTLRRIREEKAAEDRGFTLIELLVVVVIIGILVAIAIPLYLNYRNGAENKSAQSDLRNAVPVVEQIYADSQAYPATNTDLTTVGAHVSNNTDVMTFVTPVAGGYCITDHNTQTGKHYEYKSSTGKIDEGTCT